MIQTISFEVQNKYEQMLKASASGTPLPQPLPQARFKTLSQQQLLLSHALSNSAQ